jgi:curved DNA-binding protein CbpA
MKGKSNEKALTYFQTCLQVLGLEEEVALTEEELKKAYKKAAIKAHPDKRGGSEKHFEAVTRAYAYLTEILGRVNGGRKAGLKKVEEPNLLKTERTTEAEQWKHVEPVRFNPDKLDLNAFNKMFEQTRIPEPDEDGYGDWLQQNSDTNAPKFSGKFNRDVFNSMFEQEAQKAKNSNTQLAVASAQALMLNPTAGVELGRDKPADFTAPINAANSLQYTDLRAAYSTESTFSGQVADVRVEARDFGSYQESRKRAPDPLRNDELSAIQQMEREAEDREKRRQFRAAQEIVASDEYRERMKRLVLTDGKPIDQRQRR